MNLATTIGLYANRKLHYRTKFQGLPISIENRKGSVRRGGDAKTGKWSTKMSYPYGYIRGTKGMDGSEVDVFLGPQEDAKMAYVVTIKSQPDFKKDDEQKIMLGFPDAQTAKKVFFQHYNDKRFFGSMEEVPMEEFRKKCLGGPEAIAAHLGEPQVYDGGYSHIEPVPTYHAPSNKKHKPVPVDSPVETDDEFGDVTRRKSAATKAFRDKLTKKHTDANWRPLSSTQVSGFPSGTVGGFG